LRIGDRQGPDGAPGGRRGRGADAIRQPVHRPHPEDRIVGIDRVRAWMAGEGIGAAFLTNPVSIAYLTGFATNPHERLMALVVRGDGAVLVVPGLEEESAAERARGVSVRAWRDGDDPWAAVAEALGNGAGRLAVEKGHLSLARWERLSDLADAA